LNCSSVITQQTLEAPPSFMADALNLLFAISAHGKNATLTMVDGVIESEN
jgi:hypothetical protein